MTYTVKEIYYTLQGEGAKTGHPAVFCRFAGCNLWSGREEDRANAICSFCDTDFVGVNPEDGGRFDNPETLAEAVDSCWPTNANGKSEKLVVCTGGEPLLQMDDAIVSALKERGFTVAVETNGTQIPPNGIDWICVSPKAGADCVLKNGSELKFVFPQPGVSPAMYATLDFERFFLQPMDGPNREENTQQALAYCLKHPQWELSVQTHKVIGIR